MQTQLEPMDWPEVAASLDAKELGLSPGSNPKQALSLLLNKKSPRCPVCKRSDSYCKHGTARHRIQRYYCKHCTADNGGRRRTFSSTTGSIVYRIRKPKEFIQFARYMYTRVSFSLREGARACGISVKTAKRYRHLIGRALVSRSSRGLELSGPEGVIFIPFMEKGGSSRSADREVPSEGLPPSKFLPGAQPQGPVRLSDAFTVVMLRQGEEGRYRVCIGFVPGRNPLPDDSGAHSAYLSELMRYFNGTFMGVSTRYVGTYVCWFELGREDVGFGELMSELVSDRECKEAFYATERMDIWELESVQYLIPAA